MGISIKNICAGYNEKTILHDVSLEAQKGTLVLMGPSGCGKSTLLLVIMGVLKPASGSIVIDGRDVTAAPIESRNIGYVPQDFGLFSHLDVFNNIAYGLKVRGVSKLEQSQVVHDMLQLVDLVGYETKSIRSLSGGQRQRVALVRALAMKPSILLLDEPLSSIDQLTKFEVAMQLRELFAKLNIPVILVSHNQQDAMFFADTLSVMIDGTIAQQGPVDQVLAAPASEQVRRMITPLHMTGKSGN